MGMQELCGRCGRRFNVRHGRDGAFVARRFFSRIVDSELHLLAALRYLPLNPTMAGICEHPEDWRWSSCRATIGLDPAPSFLAVDEVLRLFGRERDRARQRYADFVRAGLRR
jgi:putative transposase